MSNTKLTNLTQTRKIEFMNKALNYNNSYKHNIGLSKNIHFGIEIEAIGTDFVEKMEKRKDISHYEMPLFRPRFIYEMNQWILTNDKSLNEGGEISSPILCDDKKSWVKIKSMLKYMKKNISNLNIDDSCSSHIHFNADVFEKNPEKLYSFIILLCYYEPILTKFFNGEFNHLRNGAKYYAKPFSNLVLNSNIKLDSYYSLLTSLYADDFENKYKKYAFDFSRLYMYEKKEKGTNTFENRLPNGTLNPIIIQNNIMLTGYLLENAISGKFDYEKYKNKLCKSKFEEEKAIFEIADMLPNDEFKKIFFKQYKKDYKNL